MPKPPGPFDGVGDYALVVAKKLRQTFGYDTVFGAREFNSTADVNGFKIVPLNRLIEKLSFSGQYDHVILHYVNYGYQKRGVPSRLLPVLRELRKKLGGRLLTIFHELYASGPPWKSAFWLQPWQIRIARLISDMSDVCVVSSETLLTQLKRLAPDTRAHVHPVPSNFGEPVLSPEQVAHRDPHRWVICGGTALIERSLRSFRTIVNRIPESFYPRELFVVGGNDNPATRSLLAGLEDIRSDYRPQLAVLEASQILSPSSFAWLDYFRQPGVPTAVLLKSTAFAAACAHAVIPVLPHGGSAISMGADRLPGPYFVDARQSALPEDRGSVASQIYAWYRRRASSEQLVRGIAHALDLR